MESARYSIWMGYLRKTTDTTVMRSLCARDALCYEGVVSLVVGNESEGAC